MVIKPKTGLVIVGLNSCACHSVTDRFIAVSRPGEIPSHYALLAAPHSGLLSLARPTTDQA